jgi:uncharacterized membrane protein
VSKPSRIAAFLAYLLSAVGCLYVLLARRRDDFAVYHVRQSLALLFAAVGLPLLWAAVSWVLAWIPTVGPVLGAMLFSLVIAGELAAMIDWFIGMSNALRGRQKALPLIGAYAEGRRPIRDDPIEVHKSIDTLDATDVIETSEGQTYRVP